MLNDILFCLLGKTGGIFTELDQNFSINEKYEFISTSEKELLMKIADIGYKYKLLKNFINNSYEIFNRKLIKSNFLLSKNEINSNQNNHINSKKDINKISFGENIMDINELENPRKSDSPFPNNKPQNDDFNNNNTNHDNLSSFMTPICQTLDDFLHNYETEIMDLENIFYNNLNLTSQYIISRINPYNYKFEKIFEFLQTIINENYKGGELLNLLFDLSINGDEEIKNIFVNIFINCNKILINYLTLWIINGNLTTNEFFILTTNSLINLNNPNNSNENFIEKEFENSKLELESWNANFYIEYSNIPNYFPQTLAEDILFIGKAMKILKSTKNNEEDKIPNEDISIFYTSLQKLNDIIFNYGEEVINVINIEILTKILTLIKNCTAKYLWKLVVSKYDFIKHLDAVKNIFLTFSGEFYHNFINKIKVLLNMPFDKRIEAEINDVHFKNSIKEVFNIEIDTEKELLYGKFKIKLISHGFNYNFQDTVFTKDLIDRKEISLVNCSYYNISNSLRFMNTIYKSTPGAVWNTSSIDVEEEFNLNLSLSLKNFTKNLINQNNNNILNENKFISPISNFNNFSNLNSKHKNENEILRNSLIKSVRKHQNYNNDLMDIDNNSELRGSKIKSNLQNFIFSIILHNSKNFEIKNIPSTLENLVNFFNFEFIIKYNNLTNKPNEMEFNLKFVNKTKKNNFLTSNNTIMNKNNINEGEYILYTKKFNFSNNNLSNNNNNFNNANILPADFLSNENITSININFKDNYCFISNDSKTLNFNFHFLINDYLPKEKRKIFIGILFKSQNIDIAVDLNYLNFNVFSGDIYNENSNLILIDYNPPWPHKFIFNDNVLKMYNSIFNLLFPLKTNLILLNNIWIEKKNLAKKENYIFTNIDSVHAEFVCFLQNLISFFMFDILELKYKNFLSKIEDCKDFEVIVKYHEEFLGDVISNSFVKSKKIMNLIFDILFTTRKFCNFVENTLTQINLLYLVEDNNQTINIDENLERIKIDLERLRKEFNDKVKSLIDIFTKIKNSKYYTIISQLLIKLNYTSNSNNY